MKLGLEDKEAALRLGELLSVLSRHLRVVQDQDRELSKGVEAAELLLANAHSGDL